MARGEDNPWWERPVLVTGASGLLGGWLTLELLARGAEVVTVLRDRVPHSRFAVERLGDRVTTVAGDVTDQDLIERVLSEYEVRTVFHLAAQTIVGVARNHPTATFESNIKGTWSVLDACRRVSGVTEIVTASSDKAYGEAPELPYAEDTPLRGRAPYDVSKSCADLIAQSYAATYRTPVCVTRCGNLFGGGDLNWNRLIPGTLRALLNGRAPVIRSDGSPVRDYLYVEDAVHAYLRTAEALMDRPDLAGRAYNFSLEQPLSVTAMLSRITAAVGTELAPTFLGDAPGEIQSQVLSSEAARADLGWAPVVGLEAGLARTTAWYRDHLREAA